MKENNRQGSVLTTIVATGMFFLVLAIFGKSVQAAGLLVPKGAEESTISMKSHNVTVTINNGFAKTEVDQIFMNTGDMDLEALYSFPLPKKASLSELSLFIDGQEVIGEVLEKQKAREVYESQKAQGKNTAIAEKDGYKTFDVSVYPVRANDETRIRLVYYQQLDIDLNIGRYVYPLQEGGVDEERISFWSVDAEVKESFTFDLVLKSAQKVAEVRLPGYMQNAQIEEGHLGEELSDGSVYRAHLDFSEGASLSEDIVFYYRLDDTTPARVEIIPFKNSIEEGGTFMLTITPGASLERISEGVDWVFVLDNSGSMSGQKLSLLADGVSRVIGKMSPLDRIRVITFNSRARDITHGFVDATPENVQQIVEVIKGVEAGGGTALYEGMSKGLKRIDSERTTSMILVTDGVANIGPSKHADFLKLIDAKDMRLFTFIIGNSANVPLLETLAKSSGGFSMSMSGRDDMYGRILQAKNKVLYEALHGVEVKFTGGGMGELTPASPGSLYRGQQLVMFGKYTKPGPVKVKLSAKISGEEKEWFCEAILPEVDTDNPELERLWALSAIESQMEEIRIFGESESVRTKIVDLGLEYSLVTDYTSMLVIDEEEMESLGLQRKNANRVTKERAAQAKRSQAPATNYRVDKSSDGGMFKGAPSHGVGSGPVGPLFLLMIVGCKWLVRRSQRSLK